MSPASTAPSTAAALARLGSSPTDEHEARAFFERRLRTGVGVLVWLWGAAWGINIGFTAAFIPQRLGPILRFPPTWVSLFVFLALLVMRIWLRRSHDSPRAPIPHATLEAMDAWATVLQGIGIGVMLWPTPREFRPELGFLFGAVLILVLRAAIVPSAPRRTAVIGALTCLPTIIATYPVQARGEPNEYFTAPWIGVLGITIWSAASIACTVVISAVIYGLAKRIREAMQLGQYTLVEKIGEGGMGVVYRARHALLRRPTAIKLLPDASSAAVARFEREVQRTSELGSPHVVDVYDFGRTAEGVFYYAMELLDGIDLDTLVREDGPQPPARVRHLLRQIAEALAEAHEVGLVHRDVKPANVIVVDRPRASDHAKLLDFGLVKELDTEADDSERGPSGTPLYMSPEAFSAPETVDDRSDLYGLGAIGYVLLTGKPPFVASSMMELAALHQDSPVTPPSMCLGRPVPKKLELAVMACLAKTVDARPETAEAFIEMLDECDDVEPWTHDEAHAWWASRAPGIMQSRKKSPVATPQTLGIDVAAR